MGPNFFFSEILYLGELQNEPKMGSSYHNGADTSIVSEIEYLGELHFWAQDMFQITKLGELQYVDSNIVSEILVSSKMGPSQEMFQRLNILVYSTSGPKKCFRY